MQDLFGTPQLNQFSGKKGVQTQTVGSGYLPMGGSLSCEGVGPWGPKVRYVPRAQGNLGRISWDFCMDIPGVPKKSERKKCMFNCWPLNSMAGFGIENFERSIGD